MPIWPRKVDSGWGVSRALKQKSRVAFTPIIPLFEDKKKNWEKILEENNDQSLAFVQMYRTDWLSTVS